MKVGGSDTGEGGAVGEKKALTDSDSIMKFGGGVKNLDTMLGIQVPSIEMHNEYEFANISRGSSLGWRSPWRTQEKFTRVNFSSTPARPREVDIRKGSA